MVMPPPILHALPYEQNKISKRFHHDYSLAGACKFVHNFRKYEKLRRTSVTRKNSEILRIECKLEGDAPDDYMGKLAYATRDWDGLPCNKVVSYLFKYFPNAKGNSFDYFPRLIREPVLFRPVGKPRACTGNITLNSTVFDPLGDIAVGSIVNIFYGKFNNTMLPGKIVTRAWNPFKFAKHAFFKNDFTPTLLENFDANRSKRAKEILKAAMKY